MQDRRFYVYVHRRKTDGSIFYVGKGSGKRCVEKQGRNIYWHRVATKYGWYCEKPYQNLTEPCAHSIEMMLINSIGRKSLCNLSDGGEGSSNPSQETREKLRLIARGRKNKSAIDAMNKAVRRPIINSDGEIFGSLTEACEIMSGRMGRKIRSSHVSCAARGLASYAYGMSWSYDTATIPGKPNLGNRRRP